MATDYIGLEFRAGLWAGDTNLEMFCIGVITKAKELSEITQRIKADESRKAEPWGPPLFSGLGNEEEPKEWKPRERHRAWRRESSTVAFESHGTVKF